MTRHVSVLPAESTPFRKTLSVSSISADSCWVIMCTFLIGHIADPNDFIFPRIATRTGIKFQATVPAAPDPTPTLGMRDWIVCGQN